LKKIIVLLNCLVIASTTWAQNKINVSDNLVVENIPDLSINYINEVKNYVKIELYNEEGKIIYEKAVCGNNELKIEHEE
jgi:hypothetical protein